MPVRREVMDKVLPALHATDRIRNIVVIAHVDHGKSTTTDSLIARAGLMAQANAGSSLFMDTDEEEQKRGITIKSTAVSLPFDVQLPKPNPHFNPNWPGPAPADAPADQQDQDHEEDDKKDDADKPPATVTYLVNLIDSPGHVDFSSEVTSALRVTDGALVLVDCVEGVCVQTRTVLQQALRERIKPVLFMNKMDRLFMELDMEPEECYQLLQRTIENVNVVIATHRDDVLGDVTVYPQAGTVAFGSGKQGWAFTLRDFAKIYHNEFNISVRKMMKKLWGDNFWDPAEKKWVTQAAKGNTRLQRGFVMLVLKPLRSLFKSILAQEEDKVAKFVAKFNLAGKLPPLAPDVHLEPKDTLKRLMQAWLPAADGLLQLIVEHLPSPREAQKYRMEALYEGPMDDDAAQAIRACDPNGPLLVYVSKMVPNVDKTRFFALGRVFSGTARTSQEVRIQGPDYVPGQRHDLHVKRVQNTVLFMGPFLENVSEVPAGNIVGLVGIDQYLVKSGTITTLANAHNFATMKYSVAPVVRVAVSVVDAAHLDKLTRGLKRLAKSDQMIQTYLSPLGEHIVAGCGELHLEVCLKDLQEKFMEGVPLRISDPVVPFRESVGAVSSLTVLSKSPNALNRMQMTAEPLDNRLCEAIDAGRFSVAARSATDMRERNSVLVSDYKWDLAEAKKIWCFGGLPDGQCNVLVDASKGVPYLNEVKDSILSTFASITLSGVLADEPMRGIRFNLQDMKIHGDSMHRGIGQIGPATRSALYACQLASSPRLMEPMFSCEVSAPASCLSGVYATLRRRHALLQGTSDASVGNQTVQAFLPVRESFGFAGELRKATGGQAFPLLVFSHWQAMDGDATDPAEPSHQVLMAVRARKGLSAVLPKLADYHFHL